jgi:hypothetical protein
MKIHRHTLFEAVLARLSFGAVPVDGSYWFDPKWLKPSGMKP